MTAGLLLLLLLALTAAVVLLPMLPALAEWRRPSDVMPLHIDSRDAQDPAYMAGSFAQQLTTALTQRRTRLGQSLLLPAPHDGRWLRNEAERRAGATRHVFYAEGSLALPPDADLLGEVAATGDMRTAVTRVYRALWAGGILHLGPETTVLRWAHGEHVRVAGGCRLGGRISAAQTMTVGHGVAFRLLHAPVVQFGDDAMVPGARRGRGAAAMGGLAGRTDPIGPAGPAGATGPAGPAAAPGGLGLPDAVQWNAAARRGVCPHALQIGPGRAWRGDLVCHGDLLLGRDSRVRGSIKAWGALRLDVGSRVLGNLVATGRLVLGADCVVQGAVVSETEVLLGPGCVIGAPGAPATVTAPRISVASGVTVHGTLWATEKGQSPEPAGAGVLAPEDSEPWPEQAWA